MHKQMRALSVRTTDQGEIEVLQPDDLNQDDISGVIITPNQVDVLIAWLQEARAELAGTRITAVQTA